jgi:cytochrome c oxidase subunit 2
MRRGKTNFVEMLVVGAIASAVGIVGALLINWFPEDASTQAGPIDTLWDVLLIVSIPIFVLVTIVVIYSVKYFRMRPGEEQQDGDPIHGNTRLEVVWTAIPAALIAGLVVYAYLVLVDIEKAPANADAERIVEVRARQFTWDFTYPGTKGPDGKPINSHVLYLPVDESVKFNVRTDDVLHDFFVPEFRIKIDAVPGITTHFRVTPNKEGRFQVVCMELCGLGHAFMRSYVQVVSRADFDKWITEQAKPPAEETSGGGGGETASADGKAIFTDTGCNACHTLADAGSSGTTGPDLDKVLAGKDADFIHESIVNPSAELAEGFQDLMPKDYESQLSPEELDALVNYLAEVTSK